MTYQEKRSIMSMLTAAAVFISYWLYLYRHYYQDLFVEENLKFWGTVILLMIPIFAGVRIVMHILFVILMKVSNGESEPPADEREKLIELKSSRIGSGIFMVGFLLAMISLTMEYSIQTMFLILIGFGFVGGIFEDLAQLIYHRRGIR